MSKTREAAKTEIMTTSDHLAPVTEIELAALKRDRAVLADLETQAKALAKNLDSREEDLITRIEAGAEVLGALRPTVKVVSRKSVSWTAAFAGLCKRLGLDHVAEVSQVKDATPVTMSKSLLVP